MLAMLALPSRQLLTVPGAKSTAELQRNCLSHNLRTSFSSGTCKQSKNLLLTEQCVDDASEDVDGDEDGVDDVVGAGVEREGGREGGAVGALRDEEAGVEGGAVDADQEDAVREADAPAATLPLPHRHRRFCHRFSSIMI